MKIQDLGLAGLYKENDEIRKVVKSLVALALIPSEDVHRRAFCKTPETLPPDTPLMPFLEYYENTWLGACGRLGRRTKTLFDLPLWDQYEKALDLWHTAFHHSPSYIGQISVVPKEGTKLDRSENFSNTSWRTAGQIRKVC